MPGSGTMTPIAPGAGIGLSLARPIPHTLLSLPRYAQILGINPVHFAGGNAGDAFPYGSSCNDFWHKYQWQDADRASKTDLALAIGNAERDIAEYLGYWPAPKWENEEVHRYTRFHRLEMFGNMRDIKAYNKAVRLNWGRIVSPGVRDYDLVGTATTGGLSLQYTDEDGDGFYETATITLPTTLTNACEIKVYHSQQSANQDWEIRPHKSITADGVNVQIIFDSWLFIDPDLYEDYPSTTEMTPIDITTIANFVTTVDVYREYTDPTSTSATLYWEPGVNITASSCTVCSGTGCTACVLTSQTGCLHIRDYDQGMGVPTPASYDTDSGVWSNDTLSVCREPDLVKVNYKSGDQSERYLRGVDCDPLSDYWAKIIADMATARLERPFCSCKNLLALQERMREDLIFTRQGAGSRFVTDMIQQSPFGTLRGEVIAWQKVSKLGKRRRARVAVV